VGKWVCAWASSLWIGKFFCQLVLEWWTS
jgi:hypothetical protein